MVNYSKPDIGVFRRDTKIHWDTANELRMLYLQNRSGQSVTTGEVVVWDTANPNSFKLTTTEGDVNVCGVIAQALDEKGNAATQIIDNLEWGWVQTAQRCPKVKLTTTATVGDFIQTSTTAGLGIPSADARPGSFAIALTSGTEVECLLGFISPSRIGLNIGAGLLYTDLENRRVGIRTEKPEDELHIAGDVRIEGINYPTIRLWGPQAGTRNYTIYGDTTGQFGIYDATYGKDRLIIKPAGEMMVIGVSDQTIVAKVRGWTDDKGFCLLYGTEERFWVDTEGDGYFRGKVTIGNYATVSISVGVGFEINTKGWNIEGGDSYVATMRFDADRARFWTPVAGEVITITEGGNFGIQTPGPGNILTVVENSATDPIADAWTIYSTRQNKQILEVRTKQAFEEFLNYPVYCWKYNLEKIEISSSFEENEAKKADPKALSSKKKFQNLYWGLLAEEAPPALQTYTEADELIGINSTAYIGWLHAVLYELVNRLKEAGLV